VTRTARNADQAVEDSRLIWAPWAWVDGAWQERVLLEKSDHGHWGRVTPGVNAPLGSLQLRSPALPGMVNAHSHAFQRAFAGLAERRTQGQDDFWTWRDRMYGVALSITPAELQRWATRLYRELLAGGYTQVCEFHYLHHQPDGKPYEDELAMAQALIAAARSTGIGLTLLPVLYERAGFAQAALRPDQRRFATGAADVLRMFKALQVLASTSASQAQVPPLSVGVAIHSLRAAAPASIADLVRGLQGQPVPIHIHVAEQTAEVDDCLAATGMRPIEWLTRHVHLDSRWQLVHATHALPHEIDAVGATGAGVVLCPSTEANLGDGIPDTPHWLRSGSGIAIGSDSHVTRAWPEELRWLEYAQRLQRRQRNVCAEPASFEGSTAERLFECSLHGGGRAAGFERWGLRTGARADLLVLDPDDSIRSDLPPKASLDALVFSSPCRVFDGVMVAGRWVKTPLQQAPLSPSAP
jgi:formimidoylglutamate deiminase